MHSTSVIIRIGRDYLCIFDNRRNKTKAKAISVRGDESAENDVPPENRNTDYLCTFIFQEAQMSTESMAVSCAEKLFNELSTSHVRYKAVNDYKQLLDVMKSIR